MTIRVMGVLAAYRHPSPPPSITSWCLGTCPKNCGSTAVKCHRSTGRQPQINCGVLETSGNA